MHELEELKLIKVLQENFTPSKTKLSEKYNGVFSKEDAKCYNEHTQQTREEWDAIL